MGFRVVVRSIITPVRGDHMHDMHGSVFDGLHVIILTRSLSPYKMLFCALYCICICASVYAAAACDFYCNVPQC